ncbi:MarR family transcriptional regulator [Streptomyces roseirectus]|uniref:MarR family transcriptional regulator n=1 Tax=Streptomyces roseirectus TaxID=2768066 RepID=A0A7H0I6Z9_9ACTN|nr:MarR family transcriptional regulator [Streptomyces roseirectus]QNP68565.1 MarR family transcriptional regulator [Streptomyces roseirectus]
MEPTPRWLTPEERRAWLAYVEFSTHLADHLNRQLRRDAGMTHTDYVLLAILSESPDRKLTMSELAERLRITRSRLTHAVTRLQESGYVDREDCPHNRRTQLAVLTPDGMRLLEQVAPGHVEAVRQAVFDALTPDQVTQLAEIGEAVNTALHRIDADSDHDRTLPWRRR